MPAKAPAKKTKTETFSALESALTHLEAMLKIPSATNHVEDVADYVCQYAAKQGYTVERQLDDTVFVKVPGKSNKKLLAKKGPQREIGYGAHLDRIGLMVDELHEDGTIQFSAIGGLYPGHIMDGVIASVTTEKGTFSGVITHVDAPIHKMGLVKFAKREHEFEKLRLRLDACIGCTKKDGEKTLEKLGVEIGQLVQLDTMLHIDKKHKTLRSRWLDNTLGCVALLALMDKWKAEKFTPEHTIALIFSAAEEAGMGGTSVIYPALTDFISVDVGIGEEAKNVKDVLILQKAGKMPYNHKLVKELEAAAEQAEITFARKVLKGGGTDAEQARGAGFKGRIASIDIPQYGMHSIEATTFEALEGVINVLHSHASMK